MTDRDRNPIGGHVPVAGGLAAVGVPYARALGAEAVQVFVANPRGWATPPGRPAQDEEFRAACAAEGLAAYVHAPYLINLGSHNALTAELSVVSLRHSLRRAAVIGARGVVVHTGSATGGRGRPEALAQVRRLLLPLLAELSEDAGAGPDLLLEPTAGQGASLCSRIADLGPYLDALDRHPRLGVCLDTCHVFAAGHDLAAPGGAAAALDELVRVAGPGRLKLVHANDSQDVVGAHKDRHANIGAGHIGAAPFAELFRHPATAGVPLVIETPGRAEGHTRDVARLKELRASVTSGAAQSSGPSPGSS
ncbi:deoxyribonuclease IV [Streptomyces litchfieldiae]|uniref:Probable endonuclease 4 n=1 Tax=Streptomyces litchfieldiae TaxID=3075543 RepID=A0ABU2MY43_9ACTN|nr:deoxyribonuclease IV [Streptomyces sp. DSM 44938]MDT0346549.1 deoxyribonuclease IV [Streptomyces sp. DSM 44938]